MHDDIPLTTGRAARVLTERIRPAIHSARIPLEISANRLPGEPIAPAAGLALEFEPFEAGSPWGPAWSTTWFRVRGRVPAAWAGRRVEAVVDLGFDPNMPGFQCEGLVYLPSGEPVKSLNPRNQWVRIAEEAAGDEEVEFYIEAAANPVLLDYHPFLPTQEGDIQTSSPRPLYTVRHMDLAVFEPESFATGTLLFGAAGTPGDTAGGRLTLRVIRDALADVHARRDDPNLHLVDGLALYGEADAATHPLPDRLHPSPEAHHLIGERFAAIALQSGGVRER